MNFDNDAAGLAIGLMFVLVGLAFWLVVSAIQVGLAYAVLSRIPIAHRKQSLGMLFLLFIPLFSIIWMFFVHPKVAESLQSYFRGRSDDTKGDCGYNLALWSCILSVVGFVPMIGLLASLAGLVLFILFYVKAFSLSGMIAKLETAEQPQLRQPPVA